MDIRSNWNWLSFKQWCCKQGRLQAQRWMGHCRSSREKEWDSNGPHVCWYHLWFYHQEKAVVLHHQPYHPLCADYFSSNIGVLLALWFWGKNNTVHFSSAGINGLFTAHFKDCSANFFGRSSNWQVPNVYHGPGNLFHRHQCLRIERPPSVTYHSHHARLGEASISQEAAGSSANETARKSKHKGSNQKEAVGSIYWQWGRASRSTNMLCEQGVSRELWLEVGRHVRSAGFKEEEFNKGSVQHTRGSGWRQIHSGAHEMWRWRSECELLLSFLLLHLKLISS